MMSGETVAKALGACLDRGVREFAVCGGARNAPLMQALSRLEGVTLWSHFEERGAGFFGLGRIMATGRPVAVVTTSGTAAAELLPAVIEAQYQRRPLVLVTADRPKRFRGSGAPQAIEQVGLFGSYVEGADDLDGESGEEAFAGWSGWGPWHLNVCLEEREDVPDLRWPEREPEAARAKRPGVAELVSFLNGGTFRGVVAMVGGLEPEEREDVFYFLKDLGVPVVADATSGLREALGNVVLTDGDGLLMKQPPGKVLRLGDVPVGRFWRDLEALPAVEVLSVTRSGFSGLARRSTVIEGGVGAAVRGMGKAPQIGDILDYLPRSAKRRGLLEELLEHYPDGEQSLMRILSTYATVGESVYLGNSLPIREWNLCAQMSVPIEEVLANRGANGIDGQLSTWLGVSARHEGAWGVFGDLTTLYDLSAPALLSQCVGEGRVLAVMNNGGGKIFERLPRLAGMSEGERVLMTNAHELSFEPWAAMWGMDYVRVESREEFDHEPHHGPLVMEICPDADQTAAFWKAWRESR